MMVAYHDEEWGVPERSSRALWEKLMLDGFQAGLSWSIVLRKRAALRECFAGFEPAAVARFGARDVARLLRDERIIRSRAKIEATIAAARIVREMEAGGEDFADFCWAFVGGKPLRGDGVTRVTESEESRALSKELKRRGFKFVGPVIVYAFMQAVGMVNDHDRGCFRRAPLGEVTTRVPPARPRPSRPRRSV
jgi:DNA-3-methyladenine glycosylase I